MITDGFLYIAVLIFIAALLINAPKIIRGKFAEGFFKFAPPVVLIYLVMMLLCTYGLWDLDATSTAYSDMKNPILYAMIFLMLLRCDLRKILKLGPKMLLGFFAATLSIGIGFVVSHLIFKQWLGADSWKSLGALCGSWMGGGGNMLAIQAALNIDEADMAYALVMDSICATLFVMFLLWAIGFAGKFNKWTKADTETIDEVGKSLERNAGYSKRALTYQNIAALLGISLLMSGLGQIAGAELSGRFTFFDTSTWTVLVVTLAGIILALTPLGNINGTEEISNMMLYIVIALIASRADLGAISNAHIWLLAGLVILVIHVLIMVILAKIFHMDIFTCCVASLANIGGTATAPVLAGTYSNALVPVGIIMALLGYVVGTVGGLGVARIMSMF